MNISVIIPTLNEEALIFPLVRHLLEKANGHVLEVIVADGGSHDQTVSQALAAGAKVVRVQQPSRARQMNAGAWAAQGEILHFIHADSWPPAGFDEEVVQAIKRGKRCGCFRSRFNTRNKFLLFNSFCTRFPGLLFRGGGQTLFVERELFWRVRGYDETLLVMEEYDLIKRLVKQAKFEILQKEVLVSARKYAQNGNVRLQAAYGTVMFLYFLGFSQPKLLQVYRSLIK